MISGYGTTEREWNVLTIMAKTMSATWTGTHLPVLSMYGESHWLYTKYDTTEPHGNILQCPRNCGRGRDIEPLTKKSMTVTCRECNAMATFDKVPLDTRTGLGYASVVKTEFPRKLARVSWIVSESETSNLDPPSLSLKVKVPAVSRSRSADQIEERQEIHPAAHLRSSAPIIPPSPL